MTRDALLEVGEPVLVRPSAEGAQSMIIWSPRSTSNGIVVPLWFAEPLTSKEVER